MKFVILNNLNFIQTPVLNFMFGWPYISHYIRILNRHYALLFDFISLPHLYMFRDIFGPSSRCELYKVAILFLSLLRRLSVDLDDKEIAIQAHRQSP
jgi:hypothetical protein